MIKPGSGAGRAGPDLSRRSARPAPLSRRSLAGIVVVLGLMLVPGGTMLVPSDRTDTSRVLTVGAGVVARQETASLVLPRAATLRDPASLAVSQLIRRPFRLTDPDAQAQDLPALSRRVLAGFGHVVAPDDPLHRLLVRALAQGQSDAYIDAVLNAAAARGDFQVPVSLRTLTGGVDTARLLAAFLNTGAG